MSSKRKKSTPSWPKRVFTTKKISEMTEQRRLGKGEVSPPSFLTPRDPQMIKEEKVIETKKKEPISLHDIIGSLVLILSLIFIFLIVSSKSSESWVNAVAAHLNAWIIEGSFLILRIMLQGASIEGSVLNTHYYKISLQGDLVALYSLELLIVFAALFAFFQYMSWAKKGVVFLSLIPLAIIANILRVVVAFGLALNNGPAYADRYFHGVLVVVVFLLIVVGLIIFELLFAPD